jgi:hypothetical protein
MRQATKSNRTVYALALRTRDLVAYPNGFDFACCVEFWRDDLARPKVHDGISSLSNALDAVPGWEGVFNDSLARISESFMKLLDSISTFAIALGATGSDADRSRIRFGLCEMDDKIVTPFCSFLVERSNEIRAESREHQYNFIPPIIKSVCTNPKFGGSAKMHKLNSKLNAFSAPTLLRLARENI